MIKYDIPKFGRNTEKCACVQRENFKVGEVGLLHIETSAVKLYLDPHMEGSINYRIGVHLGTLSGPR